MNRLTRVTAVLTAGAVLGGAGVALFVRPILLRLLGGIGVMDALPVPTRLGLELTAAPVLTVLVICLLAAVAAAELWLEAGAGRLLVHLGVALAMVAVLGLVLMGGFLAFYVPVVVIQ